MNKKPTKPAARGKGRPSIAVRWTIDLAGKEFNVDWRTLSKRIAAESIEAGDDGKYSTAQIAQAIFGESEAESRRQLNVKRGQQIDLDMEVTRKERIPLEDIETVNDRVMQNIAGLLKAHNGKLLDETLIGDIFTELREMGASLKNG